MPPCPLWGGAAGFPGLAGHHWNTTTLIIFSLTWWDRERLVSPKGSEQQVGSYDKPRQCVKKQRHHFADKGPCSQGCGLFSQFSHLVTSDSAIPWITAHQASLCITNSRSSPKLMCIESVMPSSHLILCCPLLLLPPNPSQHQGLFQWVNSLHQVAKILEFQPQHSSLQWTPRTDLL